MNIGTQIRAKRVARKMNQRKLAADVGLHFSVLNRIERGHRSPSFAEMERIAKALGCPVRALVPAKRRSA